MTNTEQLKPIDPRLLNYLKLEKAFVVDSVASSRRRLVDMLVSIGMPHANIKSYGTVEDVEREFDSIRPRIIISDYQIGNRYGFDMFNMQKSKISDQDSIVCILVTANQSQSTVARAAEEDVDGFILKPYTLKSLNESLVNALMGKLFPSDYYLKIRQAKALLYAGKIDEALPIFESARPLDPSPTMALYYIAQCNALKQLLAQAETKYEEVLDYNTIHLKSLTGLFDLLMKKNDFKKAYSIMQKIMANFPANPVRMTSAIRLAITTKNYKDIEKYYKDFTTIEPRTDELVKYVCSGMTIVAIHYFEENKPKMALEALTNASISCAGYPSLLRKMVEVLVTYGQSSEIPNILKRFSAANEQGLDYKVSALLMSSSTGNLDKAYAIARELEGMKESSSVKYKALIEFYAKIKKQEYAKNLYLDAIKLWPNDPDIQKCKTLV